MKKNLFLSFALVLLCCGCASKTTSNTTNINFGGAGGAGNSEENSGGVITNVKPTVDVNVDSNNQDIITDYEVFQDEYESLYKEIGEMRQTIERLSLECDRLYGQLSQFGSTNFTDYQWKEENENWYFVGRMAGWQLINSKWYYIDPISGSRKTGWQQIDGKWYYMDPINGEMKTGWQQIDGKWYYMKGDGECLVNGTTPDGYRVNERGELIQ